MTIGEEMYRISGLSTVPLIGETGVLGVDIL